MRVRQPDVLRLPLLPASPSFRRYSLHHKTDVTSASKHYSVFAAFGSSLAGAATAAAPPWPHDPRLPALGRRAVLPRGSAPAPTATWKDYQRWRILQGVAEGDTEIPSGEWGRGLEWRARALARGVASGPSVLGGRACTDSTECPDAAHLGRRTWASPRLAPPAKRGWTAGKSALRMPPQCPHPPAPRRPSLTGEVNPLEFNLDRLNGVSFTKGCYVGQASQTYWACSRCVPSTAAGVTCCSLHRLEESSEARAHLLHPSGSCPGGTPPAARPCTWPALHICTTRMPARRSLCSECTPVAWCASASCHSGWGRPAAPAAFAAGKRARGAGAGSRPRLR